jgi:hypothetical protein
MHATEKHTVKNAEDIFDQGDHDGDIDRGTYAARAPIVVERRFHQCVGHAKSLIFLMLLPLGIALFVKARRSDIAEGLHPLMTHASSIGIVIVGGVIPEWDNIVSLIGTGGLIAIVIFLLVLEYVAGGSDAGTRSVKGLGTAQRNHRRTRQAYE